MSNLQFLSKLFAEIQIQLRIIQHFEGVIYILRSLFLTFSFSKSYHQFCRVTRVKIIDISQAY